MVKFIWKLFISLFCINGRNILTFFICIFWRDFVSSIWAKMTRITTSTLSKVLLREATNDCFFLSSRQWFTVQFRNSMTPWFFRRMCFLCMTFCMFCYRPVSNDSLTSSIAGVSLRPTQVDYNLTVLKLHTVISRQMTFDSSAMTYMCSITNTANTFV